MVLKRKIKYQDDDDLLFQAHSTVALRCTKTNGQFFIAELLDDVTQTMVDDSTANVNVLYYDKTSDGKFKLRNYDVAPVQSIMCVVELNHKDDKEFELPRQYQQRINRALKSVASGKDIAKAFRQPLKRQKTDHEGTKKSNTKKKAAVVSTAKRNGRTGLYKCIEHVDDDVVDYEMYGDHGFREIAQDVLSSTNEVLRAVLTKNYQLLESLTTPTSADIEHIYSLFAPRSIGIPKCALEYAIEDNDTKAIKIFLGTKDKKFNFASKPVVATNDTGVYESNEKIRNRFNAVLALYPHEKYDAATLQTSNYHEVSEALRSRPFSTFSLFYPGDALVASASTITTKVFHCGNIEVAPRLVEILANNRQDGYTHLHLQALKQSPIPLVTKHDIMKKSAHGVTPLHLAALSIDQTHLEQFLKIIESTDLDCRDQSDWRPIHFAAVSPGSATMAVLLAMKADVSVECNEGTPLHLVCQYGRLETLKELLEHIPKDALPAHLEHYNSDGYRPLHIAAKYGFTSIVNLLLEYGATARGVTKPKDSKMTPLALAAEAGHLDCVTALLNHDAPVDAVDGTLRTPLIYAVMNGHATITRVLLNHDSDANAADRYRNTVMHYAAGYGWMSCVELLLSIGAESWSFNSAGMTPQVCAGLLCRYDVSHFLLDHLNDLSIDYVNGDGATPLFLQCQYGNSIEEINYLLSKGADPNCCTKAKLYPLQQILLRMAKAKDSDRPFLVDVVRQLLAHGAHTRGDEIEINKLPLALAIEANSIEAMEILLPLSVVTDDTWIAAIQSPGRCTLVKALIKSPHTISNGGPVLHAVAATCKTDPLPPQLFLELLQKINDVENAFMYYDNCGYVPIFSLVKNLRKLRNDFAMEMDYIASDQTASELFKIYLEHTKDVVHLVGRGQFYNREWNITTENLLHIAAMHPPPSVSQCGVPSQVWNGINILDALLEQLEWPFEQVNAAFRGSTPLLLAVGSGHVAGATKLVEIGADVNYSSPPPYLSPSALAKAFFVDNVELVEFLLKHGANPSVWADAYARESLLHRAARQPGNATCVQLLIDYGADVCAVDPQGRTPLTTAILNYRTLHSAKLFEDNMDFCDLKSINDDFDFACQSTSFGSIKSSSFNDDSVLVVLLNAPNIEKAIVIPDKDGLTCFDYAKQREDVHLERILRILSKGSIQQCFANSVWPIEIVHEAICSNNWQQALDYITSFLDHNKTTVLQQKDKNGETLMHTLARNKTFFDKRVRTIAWLLVEAGIDLSAVNDKQQTALHVAASCCNLPLCRFLLHHAPQLLDQLSNNGNTPLLEMLGQMDQQWSGTHAFITFLRQGANIKIKNHSGQSALSLYIDRFASSNSTEDEVFLRVIQRLLERGADINGLFSTTYGKICSRHGSVKPRLTLLMRTLYCQSVYRRQELLVLLLAYQCNRMEVDDEGNTALHHAIALNLTEEVQLLLQPQLTYDSDDCVAKQCELSTDQLRAFVNVQNKFGESPLHIAVRPKHEGSYENTEIALMLMNAGAKLDALDKDGKTPVDLAMEQPSGVMYTTLTKKVLPKSISIQQFADIPDIAKDAAAFMSKSQALGYIKSTPYLPTLIQSSSGSSVYVHPLTGKVYDAPMISVESTVDHSIISSFYRMQIVCDRKNFNLVAQSSENGAAAQFITTTYLDISKAMEAFHKIFTDKTGNDFDSERCTNLPGKFIPIQLPATIKEYDDLVLAPFTVGDAACSLSLPVQQALHQIANFKNLNTALTNKFGSTTTLTLAELQPPLLQDTINLLTTTRSLVVTKDHLLNTLKHTPTPALQEQWKSTIHNIVEKSAQYFQCIRRPNGFHMPFLDINSIDTELHRLDQLLEIANASLIILAAKQSALHPLEYCYKALQISLEESSSAEFDAISAYFSSSLPQYYGAFDKKKFKLSRVFKLARRAEVHRPTNNTANGSSLLLWHAATPATLMQTLQNGLQVTPLEGSSHQGITLWDTSLGCLEAYKGNSSTNNNEPQYLLLCEVDLGTQVDDYADKAGCSTFIPGQRQPNPKDAMVIPALGSCKVPLGELGFVDGNGFTWYAKNSASSTGFCNFSPALKLSPTAIHFILACAHNNESTVVATDRDLLDNFNIFTLGYASIIPTKMSVEMKKKGFLRSGRLSLLEFHISLAGKNKDENINYTLCASAASHSGQPMGYHICNQVNQPFYSRYVVNSEIQIQLRYIVEIDHNAHQQ